MAEDEGDRVSGIAAVASEAAATRAPAEANGDGGPRANGPAPEKEPTLKASPADLSPVRTTTETSSSAGAATERGASNDDLGAPSPSTRRSLAVWDYVCAELGLSVGAREDDPDMAVARERVFDIIWHIPLEFERLNFYGGMLCMDATLGVVTSLPVRVVCQTARLIMSPALGVVSAVGTLVSPSPSTKTKGGTKGSTIGSPGSRRRFNNPGDSTGGRTTSRKRRTWGFHPYAREHLSDSLWLFMLLAAFAAVKLVDVSVVYHYIRGQEVIKLYLACSVLECFDKLCCAFNCHVLDALQNSVYILVNTAQEDCSTAELINATFQLAFDAALTLAATCAHAMIMLTHAVTLSVAINSHTNAMLLVLISNNFGEIKSHIFKKMDAAKLFSVARLDIVERVHLSICLVFVAAQRVTAAGSVAGGLTRKMLKDSLMVLSSEIVVDVFKHAFMSKFNNIRPRVYRGFLRQLCREHVKLAQSYRLHRVVGFVPLAPAAVLMKVLPDLYRTLFPSNSSGDFDSGFMDEATPAAAGGGGGWFGNMRLEAGILGLVPDPSSFAAYVLFFALLVAFKLAFGVALHWLGAHMLETLHGGENERSTSRVGSPKKGAATAVQGGGGGVLGGGGGEGERLEKRLEKAFVQRSLFGPNASSGPANGDGRASADGVGEEGGVGDGGDWGGAAPESPTRRKERRPPTPKSPQYPLWSAGGF